MSPVSTFLAVMISVMISAASHGAPARPLSGSEPRPLPASLPPPLPGSEPPPLPASTPGHPAMVDGLGDTLAAGPYPQRIVSLSPNLTEILFAVGVDSQLIAGVTRYCDYPPAAQSRPVIGGIIDPSLEAIQMRRPDLVLAARGNPTQVIQSIRALGIPLFAVDDRTGLAGIARIIRQIAVLAGPDDTLRGDSVVRHVEWSLAAYGAWSDSIPPDARRTVYYADPEHPEWTAGPGSHVDDLIRLSGGANVITEGGAWPQISAERLALLHPDCLLLALPEGGDRAAILARMRGRPGWAEMPALREARICWIDAGRLLRPGPRLFAGLEELAACLYPNRHRPQWRWGR